jgi:hypothetical protein
MEEWDAYGRVEVLGRVEAGLARRRVNDPDTIRKPEECEL